MAGIHLTLPHFYIVAGYRLSERVLQLVESPLMGSAKKRLAFRRLLYRSEDFSYQYFSREHKLFFFELWIEFISTAPRRKTLSASLYRCPEGLPVISRPNSSYALLSQRYEMATAYGSPCQSCGPSRSLWGPYAGNNTTIITMDTNAPPTLHASATSHTPRHYLWD